MIDFRNLHADRVPGRYNAEKAPHKAVLLLAIIKLYENKKINLEKIMFKDMYLLETYKDIWKCLDYKKLGPISLPLFHLKTDGFYKIHFKVEKPFSPKGSLKKLLDQAERAEFNDEFVEILSNEVLRKKEIEEILTGGHFTTKEISKVNAKLRLLDKSFEYEKILNDYPSKSFETKFVKDQSKEYTKVRSGSFRRMILKFYNSTCAICRVSIIVEDISVIDAAHILPFSEFCNDDPRNGIALCKNHHWLFDNGGISISPEYRIKISNNIAKETPEGVLSQYFRKKITLPNDKILYPAKEALEWHNFRWNFI
ncbi:HNH endonuclease [Desulfococcaceae bacterium HSG9]|nr:HNH endonuclease [Desulfococcaceae bacterium HSG9]